MERNWTETRTTDLEDCGRCSDLWLILVIIPNAMSYRGFNAFDTFNINAEHCHALYTACCGGIFKVFELAYSLYALNALDCIIVYETDV